MSKIIASLALLGTALIQGADAAFPKRGLAANEDIPISQFGGTNGGRASQVNWQYNWDSNTNQKQSWAEYVPMLWGLQADHTNVWFDRASYWLANGGSGHLLGFNEPDLGSQSSLTVAQAVSGYRTYMKPFIGRASIGTPAVTNGGYNWLSQFLSQCNDCGINFIAAHWYNDHALFADFQNWVNRLCTLGNGKQVWITEVRPVSTESKSDLSRAMLTNRPAVPSLRHHRPAERLPQAGHPVARQQLLRLPLRVLRGCRPEQDFPPERRSRLVPARRPVCLHAVRQGFQAG